MRDEPPPYRRFPATEPPRCWNCDSSLKDSPAGVCRRCGARNGPSAATPGEYRCRKCNALLFRCRGGRGLIETVCSKRYCRELQSVFLKPFEVEPAPPRPIKPRRETPDHEAKWGALLADPEDFMRVMEERWRAAAVVRAKERSEMAVGLRWDVFNRDDFRCRYCGLSVEDGAVLHVDHVLPVSKGGPTSLENLVTACLDCNLGKSDKVLD